MTTYLTTQDYQTIVNKVYSLVSDESSEFEVEYQRGNSVVMLTINHRIEYRNEIGGSYEGYDFERLSVVDEEEFDVLSVDCYDSEGNEVDSDFDTKPSSNNTGLVTIPVEAEITFADCKTYSRELSQFINGQVAAKMLEAGISPNCVFADIWAQPFISDDTNPYRNLMNVLKQFANIASGGYMATIQLIAAQKEIDRLESEIEQQAEC